jgi:anti-sigma factor RsiW
MRCSSCEPLLDAFLEGMLRSREGRAVGAHLRTCPDCAVLLRELRIVDALLTTARPHRVGAGFTAAVVSATQATQPKTPRRVSLAGALLLYLGIAWTLAVLVALRPNDLTRLAATFFMLGRHDIAALDGAVRALAPSTPLAAAAVTGVLLLDLLLFCALFFGYHRVRPLVALYLGRGSRS